MSDPQDTRGKARGCWFGFFVACGLFAALAGLVLGLAVLVGKSQLDPERYRPLVEEELTRQVGAPVRVERLDWRPPDAFDLVGVEVRNPDDAEADPLFRIARVSVDVSTRGLLRKQIVARRIEVTRPELTVDFGADSFLLSHFRPADQPRRAGAPGLIPQLPGISVLEGALTLRRMPGYDPADELSFEGIEATVGRTGRREGDLRIAGRFTNDWLTQCDFHFDLSPRLSSAGFRFLAEGIRISDNSLKCLPLESRNLLLSHRLKGVLDLDLSGRYDWQEGEAQLRSLRLDLRQCSGELKHLPFRVSEVSGYVQTDDRHLLSAKLSGKLGTADVGLTGHRELGTEPAQESWTLLATGLALDDALVSCLTEEAQQLVRQWRVGGTVDARIQWTRLPEGEARVVAAFSSDDLTIQPSQFPAPVRITKGTVIWDGRTCRLANAHVRMDGSSGVVSGLFSLGSRQLENLRLEITQLVLKQELLQALPKQFRDPLGPAELSGILKGEVLVQEDTVQGQSVRFHLVGDRAEIKLTQLPAPLRFVSGSGLWNGTDFSFTEVKCALGETALTARGELPATGSAWARIEFLDAALDEGLKQTLAAQFQRFGCELKSSGTYSGYLEARDLLGKAPPIMLEVAATGAVIAHKSFPLSLSLQNLKLTRDESGLALERVVGRAGEAEVTLSGRLPDDEKAAKELRCSVKGLQLTKALIERCPESVQASWRTAEPQGTVDVEASLSLGAEGLADMKYTAAVTCRDVSARYAGFPVPLSEVTGAVTFTNGKIVFSKLKGRAQGRPASLDGVVSLDGKAATELKIQVSEIPIDGSLLKWVPADVQNSVKELGVAGTVKLLDCQIECEPSAVPACRLVLSIEDGSLSGSGLGPPVKAVSASLIWDGDKLSIQSLSGSALGGAVSATGELTSAALQLSVRGQSFRLGPEFLNSLPLAAQSYRFLLHGSQSADFACTVNTKLDGEVPDTQFSSVLSLSRDLDESGVILKDVNGVVRLKGQLTGRQLVASQGSLEFDDLTVSGHRLEDLTAGFSSQGEAWAVKELRARYCGGLVRLNLDRAAGDGRTAVKANFSDVNVSELTARLGATKGIPGLARGELEFTIREGQVDSVRGSGKLFVEGQELCQLPALLSIFSLLPNRGKNRIRELEMQYGLEGQVLKVSIVKLIGVDYSIYGLGTIDLKGALDLKAVVATRSLLKDAVDSIPAGPLSRIAGSLVDRLRTAVHQFDVQGSLREPKARLMPLTLEKDELKRLLQEMHDDGRRE